MTKKKEIKKLSNREKNAFPYLSMSLDERLQKSGAIDLSDNHIISEDGHYWTIRPIDKNKKKKR
jgi:hypothetical protein